MKIYIKHSFDNIKKSGIYAFLIIDDKKIITKSAEKINVSNQIVLQQKALLKALKKLPTSIKKIEIFTGSLNEKRCFENLELKQTLSNFSYVFSSQKDKNAEFVSILKELIKNPSSTNENASEEQNKAILPNQEPKIQSAPNPSIKADDENIINIYTDGSVKLENGKGIGGWSFLIESRGHSIITNGVLFDAEASLMELIAIIKALEALENIETKAKIYIFTDSQYVIDGVKKTPKNYKEYWDKLTPLLKRHNPALNKIKVHSGHKQNELCDKMAKSAASNLHKALLDASKTMPNLLQKDDIKQYLENEQKILLKMLKKLKNKKSKKAYKKLKNQILDLNNPDKKQKLQKLSNKISKIYEKIKNIEKSLNSRF